ncbi:MAG: LamG domain-containing protein, partial [Phycisphaerales bacterium]
MCKKLTCLAFFCLLLGLVLTSTAGAADPDLVGWWKFEEESGTLYDQSDNHNDATSFAGVLYQQPGREGYALGFDGVDDRVVVGTTGRPTDTFSFGCWLKTSVTHEIDPESTSGVGGVAGQRYVFDPQHGGETEGGAGLSVGTNGILVYEHGSNYMPATAVYEAEIGTDWNHIMIVYDNKQPTIYLNGSAVRTGLTSPRAVVNAPIQIGGMAYGFIEGLIDEVRIYSRALSAAEVKRIAGRVEAFNPSPADGAVYPETWVTLGWSAGAYAVSHDVYLGENFDDVSKGTADTFRGNQSSEMFIVGFLGFPYPDGLVPGTTYYWRVDEVNPDDPNGPWKGNVWSFTIPPRTAYNPEPGDGAEFVDPDVVLNWTAGLGARLHHVYFGDNFDDVNNADAALPQADTNYTPGTLDLDKTYYWRVDEFDGTNVFKGEVWNFTTLPVVPISDPNLIGWWKLDEGYGAVPVDWSGYGNHGIITNPKGGLGEGGSVWDTDPERGIVLSFNGNNSTGGYVSAGGIPAMTLVNDFTWSFWTKQHPNQGTAIPGEGNNLILGNRYSFTGSDPLEFVKFTPGRFEFYNNDPDYLMTVDYEDIPAGMWIHHAGVKDGTTLTYYRNGIESGSSTITKTIQANPFYMAGEPAGGGRWQGWLSDVRIYDKALTVDEIKQVMRGDPLLAWNPNPSNGSTQDIGFATPLRWSPGDSVSQHAVYFGTDRDAVDSADASDTTGVYRGQQTAASYSPPEGVEWGGGPYYWRIDEHNTDATVTKGKIWSFAVADYLTVDDFESYDNADPAPGEPGLNRIFDKWIDGYDTPLINGAVVGNPMPPYAERIIVHSGFQSMNYSYDNAGRTSEATLTLVYPRDWTEQGVTKLSLWINGSAANAADRIYVALNGTAVVYHDDGSATQIMGWTEWVIDLAEFGVG